MKRKYYIDLHPESNNEKEHAFALVSDKPEGYFMLRVAKSENYTKAKTVGKDTVYLCHKMTHFLKTPEQIKETFHDMDIMVKAENPCLMYPLEDLKRIDLKQAWNYDYFPDQGIISIYKYLRRNFSFKMYLHYNKVYDMLMLSEKKYYFYIEPEKEIINDLITSKFKLRTFEGKYLAVKNAEAGNKASTLEVKELDARHPEPFTFHFFFYEYSFHPRSIHQLIFLSSNIFMYIPDTALFEITPEFEKVAYCMIDSVSRDDNYYKQLSNRQYYFNGNLQFKIDYDAISILFHSGILDVCREFFIKKWITEKSVDGNNLNNGQQ